MATKGHEHTIPVEFIRLDDLTTSADEYVNVRDMQVTRKNHNILLARRLRRTLATYTVSDDADMTADLTSILYSINPASRDSGDVVLAIPIPLTEFTKELEVVIMAYRTSAAVDCKLYPVIDVPWYPGEIDTSLAFTVTDSTLPGSKYSCTVPLSDEALRYSGGSSAILHIYMAGIMFGADLLGGAKPIAAAGSGFVDITTVPIPVAGNAVYVKTDADIQARVIDEVVAVPGGAYRLYLETPFNKIPTPGTDTAETREAQGVHVETCTVYEKSFDDVDADTGVA